MCHSPAFALWMFHKDDQHPGALRAARLGIAIDSEQKTRMLMTNEPMPDELADKTIRDYVCSACWGHLLKFPTDGRLWIVKCHRCEETPGYVTKTYVEARRAESLGEAHEVTELLEELGILQKPDRKPETELLDDLGF